ncbi:MAG: 6-hydroxymethylpterin diphosphokinase MptE-like protein [Actinomycetota bacterium]
MRTDSADQRTDFTTEDARRFGLRAKSGHLLGVLAGDTSLETDRVVAMLALLDDAEQILQVLEPDERAALADVLSASVRAAGTSDTRWRARIGPEHLDSAGAAADGVPHVVVPAAGSAPSTTALGSFDLPEQVDRVQVLSECTAVGLDGLARLELVDPMSGSTVVQADIGSGHHHLVELDVDLVAAGSPERLVLTAHNESSSGELSWFGSLVGSSAPTATPAAAEKSLTERARHSLTSVQASIDSDAIRPPTREPLTVIDIERFTSLRRRFSGERIFIMGNGPSLNRTPLELLEDEFVFGVNRISLLFERISWRPTFYTAFDVRVVPDNAEEFAALDIPYKFFSARYKSLLGEADNHYWHHTKGFYDGFEHCFEPTVPYSGFGGGGTIGVMAVEMAYFMGFEEIYLIGTDVSYAVPKTVIQSGPEGFGDGVKLELESTADDDPNHFDPRYFGAGKKWHSPNVRDMKIGFARAAAYLDRRGARLRNATVGGELDEVERVSFESLFSGRS